MGEMVPKQIELDPLPDPSVEVIILNYNGKDLLAECLPSVLSQTYARVRVSVVDDASTDGSVSYLKEVFPSVTIISNSERLNFAKSANKGLKMSKADFIFVLNNDIILEPNCVDELVKAAYAVSCIDDAVAGIAPKMILDRFNRSFLDSVGTSIVQNGSAFNNGIGQIDLGQFDSPMRIFGLCWGAAFVRNAAFEEIGYLDDSYVAYYEDTDWAYRANIRGYNFYTAPRARAYHKHSATWRRIADYDAKYYLTHRNFLRTVAKNYYRGQLLWLAKRVLSHLGTMYISVRHRDFRRAWLTVKILTNTAWMLPKLLIQNVNLNRRRQVQDAEIWAFSSPRIVSMSGRTFDPVSYSPVLTIDVLEEIYRELSFSNHEIRTGKAHADIYADVRLVNQYVRSTGKEINKINALENLTSERGTSELRVKWANILILGTFLKRRAQPPIQKSSHNDQVFQLVDILASREPGGYRIHSKDGTLDVDWFLYYVLLACHGRSRQEVLAAVTSSLRPEADSHKSDSIGEAVRRATELVLDVLVETGLVRVGATE